MGQKVNPHGLRVGVIKDWNAKWYADKKNFADNLVEDHKIREFVKKELGNGLLVEYNAGLPEIEKREVCFAYSYRRMPNPHVMDFLDYVNEKKSDKKFNVLV